MTVDEVVGDFLAANPEYRPGVYTMEGFGPMMDMETTVAFARWAHATGRATKSREQVGRFVDFVQTVAEDFSQGAK